MQNNDKESANIEVQNGSQPHIYLIVAQVVLPIVFAATVVVVMSGKLYMKSSDFGQHYDLAQFIGTHWRWPAAGETLPSGMGPYPPLAHSVAAIVGKLIGSTAKAVNVVAILSVFGCYLLLARAISVGRPIESLIGLLVAAAGLTVGRSQSAVEGFEVYFSFFYAQMVGEFAFFVFCYWLCVSRADWTRRLAISAVVIFISGWLYPLTSVEMALGYICLEGFSLARRIIESRELRLPWAAPLVAGAVVLPLAVVLHPTFRYMATVAANNGAITLFLFNHLVPRLSVALLIVAGALGVLAPPTARWRRGTLFIATAGCGSAVAALLQFAAHKATGAGSDYAVQKYGFGVITLLIFALAAAVATLMELKARDRRWPMLVVFAPPIFAAVVTVALPLQPAENLNKFIIYERRAMAILAQKGTPAAARGDTVSHNHAFGWYLNYAASVVDLGLDTSKAFSSTQIETIPLKDDPAGYAIADNPDDAIPSACETEDTRHLAIVLVSTRCAARSASDIGVNRRISLINTAKSPPYFKSGWSGKEPTGVWSDGPQASISMHIDQVPATLSVSIEAAGYIPRADYVQHVQVRANGQPIGDWVFSAAAPSGMRTLVIPGALVKDGDLTLDFLFPDATSPADQKMSADTRHLAMFVNAFSLGQ
jgi:hypothetical protein